MGTLSQPIPLPSSTDWPEFVEVASIPYGFGREISSRGVPIDQGRTRFAWLAGRNGGVDSVQVGGMTALDWEASNTTDPAGNAITEVRFSQSVDSDPVIRGRGLLDPDTGDLIENPGRVVAFIYSLLGRTPTNLDIFTSEADRRSLKVRGVLRADLSARAQVAEIMDSVGAIWADSSPSFATFYPDTLTDEPVATVEPGITARWSLEDISTQVRVRFGYDFGEGRFLGSVLVESPTARDLYGLRTLQLDAPWLRTSADALAMARRVLVHVARPRWSYDGVVSGTVFPGERVIVEAGAGVPLAGTFPVIASRVDLSRRKSRVTLDVPTGDVPRLETVQIASAFPSLEIAATVAANSEGTEFEIVDATGAAVADAAAVLDGQTTRYTDGQGLVTFPDWLLSPGQHEIVATKGDQTTSLVFTI